MFLDKLTLLKNIESGQIIIDPFNEDNLHDWGYDLSLNDDYYSYATTFVRELGKLDKSGLTVDDNKFFLISTVEFVGSNFMGHIGTRSHAARLGLDVHGSSGFVWPGWTGRITLEVSNRSLRPVILEPNMKIATIAFSEVVNPPKIDLDQAMLEAKKSWKPKMLIPNRKKLL